MKRRSFLKGILAAGALGLALSAGPALRLEPKPEPVEVQQFTSLDTDEWRKVLADTMIECDRKIQADIYEPSEWVICSPKFASMMFPSPPWYRRLARMFWS